MSSTRVPAAFIEHFQHFGGRIIGLTAVGRVTEKLLMLNLTERVEIRRILVENARYPG